RTPELNPDGASFTTTLVPGVLGQSAAVHLLLPHIGRYRALDSAGRACRYFPVVAIDRCPSVSLTRWIGAPRSRAWLARACLRQWGETGASRPARLAAARTTRQSWGCPKRPPVRFEGKTGASSSAPSRSSTSSPHVAAESRTDRALLPLPTTVTWPL